MKIFLLTKVKKKRQNTLWTNFYWQIIILKTPVKGSIYRLTEFSQSLRHSEESLQEIEHYKFLSLVTLVELRTKFSQAFFKFEDMLKQIFNSDTPQETSQIPACNGK